MPTFKAASLAVLSLALVVGVHGFAVSTSGNLALSARQAPVLSWTRRCMTLSGGDSSPTMALQSGRKRDSVKSFFKKMLGIKPKAAMPDPALERCSTCFFPTEFHEVPLIGVKDYNYDTKIFTFALPEGVSLDLPVCACVLLRGYDEAGEPAIRPYTPTSPNDQKGSFEIMVKIYEKGVVSQWLNKLNVDVLPKWRE